ncbi:MAG: hypothetical protein AAFV95_21815 [Bacteroidota bacterium]
MIDGIKLDCSYLDPDVWRKHPELKYYPRIDEETGEIIQQIFSAKYNGLAFEIRQTDLHRREAFIQVLGSLHRYHNSGGDNADDFNRTDIASAIDDLSIRFGLCPESTHLRNLEFGVNIRLGINARQFIKGIVCMPNKKFGQMNVKQAGLGRVCSWSEYALKIYDKGRQSQTVDTNLLRIEMKVVKMRYLSKIGIQFLSDLKDTQKLMELGKLLIQVFGELIFYDGSIKEGALTSRERKKLEEFTNPYRWLNMTSRNARYMAKKKMLRFFSLHGGTAQKWSALFKVYQKWLVLAECPQQMGDVFTGYCKRLTADKKVTFSQLEYDGETVIIEEGKKGRIKKENFAKNPFLPIGPVAGNGTLSQRTFCRTCQRDISHQKRGSLFCSEKYFGRNARKCRDKAWAKNRQDRKKRAREIEQRQLKDLMPLVLSHSWQVVVSTSEVSRVSVGWKNIGWLQEQRRSIVFAELTVDNQKAAFTRLRAKELVKFIIQSKPF